MSSKGILAFLNQYKLWWAFSWFVFLPIFSFSDKVWPSNRKANILTFFILNIFFFLHYVKFWPWQECRVVYAERQQIQVNTNFSNNSKDVKKISSGPILKKRSVMSDSQRYLLNLKLIKTVEDIVNFLA